ncbi:DUF1657 domain-containing protein [Lentibacillus sp. CBA3610]|uniref:DUF1657 domain-containing protein n=1 Tax=Lentibacillus sp. CBA3610 TaxID=2518176 RepID=UPI001595800B|nr:DUF1657 domain-containing protein [Lentibacillus sp. CBA3610]QKY68876.1 DUF1657 domain-containing protein [Lentibacillus sp. CBA3610]
MTVSSQVKGCFSSVKSIEATLETLSEKTADQEAEEALKEVQNTMRTIKSDLENQVLYLTKEEPQYKS